MCIEITHDECVIIVGAEEVGEVGLIPWWATGVWGNVYVDDV